MVPAWSYMALRGRCRACGATIGARTFWVELATGLLFALAAWRIAPADLRGWATLLLTSGYLSVLVAVTVTDLEHGLILDRVTLPAVGLGLIGSLMAGWPGLLRHLGAARRGPAGSVR